MKNYDWVWKNWYYEKPIKIKVDFDFKCPICGSNLIEFSNSFKVKKITARYFVCPIDIEYGVIRFYIQSEEVMVSEAMRK